MDQIQSAGIITYRKKNHEPEYLLLHYFPKGHWDFPKGKLEQKETDEQAALRELEEETGLHAMIKPGFREQIRYIIHDNHEPQYKRVTFFIGDVPVNGVQLSDEHQGYAWLNFHDAIHRLTYENARQLLRKAHRFVRRI